MDNLNTHKLASLYEAFPPERGPADRRAAGDPPHAEARELAEHGRDRAERAGAGPARAGRATGRRWPGTSAAWKERRNGAGVKADWQFTTADARIKLRKLYPTIDDVTDH